MHACQQESPPSSCIPQSLGLTNGTTEGGLTVKHPRSHQQEPIQTTFGNLPDDDLIEIFQALLGSSYRGAGWRVLVQVCQRWQNLVFGSPLHLGVRLYCTARTSLREMLDVWPALPISITQHLCSSLSQVKRENLLAILELHQLVCEIDLTDLSNEFVEQVGQTMQTPFPVLTKLLLESSSSSPPVLPDSFLGRYAPRLRVLELMHIPFPALPNLLLSTAGLRTLELYLLPITYIPSQVMVTCLSGMSSLKSLIIEFYSSRFRHSRTSLRSPPSTRTVLPALTYLCFRGSCNYLEDLVANIGAPLLDTMSLSFFNSKREAYNTVQLSKFIGYTNLLRSPHRVDVVFYDHTIKLKLYLQAFLLSDSALELEVLYQDSGRLSRLARLGSSLSFLSNLERLDIRRGRFDIQSLKKLS